jgi:hypothetical protein
MYNIVKNLLAWADKEPITPHEAIGVFNENNARSLMLQIKQRGFELRSINDIVNPPADIAPRLGELTDILTSATDSLEYHPMTIVAIVLSLSNKAIVKKQDLFPFLYERYLVVPPSCNIHNPQARGVDVGLTNALAQHFSWKNFDKIRGLIKNESLGESRLILLSAFPRFLDKEEVRQLLLELSEHPLFAFESKKLLKRKVRKSKIVG